MHNRQPSRIPGDWIASGGLQAAPPTPQSPATSMLPQTSQMYAALAMLLCCVSSTARPAAAARLLLQGNATTAANTSTPAPSPLSIPYSAQTLASNRNFTFLPGYSTIVTGQPGTLGYAVQLVNSSTGANISAWHDIPLNLEVAGNGTITLYTMTEIPIGEQAKYETMTDMPGTPIKQDTNAVKDAQGNVVAEVPRYYMYGPSLGNYGGLPGTWSNSNSTDSITGYVGDNDPLDILDISSSRAPIGGVYKVKVLGALGMIDAKETDWKIIAINVDDPQAENYTTVLDVPQERLSGILQFFANYKAAEKKPNACFWPVTGVAHSNASLAGVPGTQPKCNLTSAAAPADYFHDKDTALSVIRQSQDNWQWLLAGKCRSKPCEELWWAGKPQEAAAPGPEPASEQTPQQTGASST